MARFCITCCASLLAMLTLAGCTMRGEITDLRATLVDVAVNTVYGFNAPGSMTGYRIEFAVDRKFDDVVSFLGGVPPGARVIECAKMDGPLDLDRDVHVSLVHALQEEDDSTEVWLTHIPLSSAESDLSQVQLSDLCMVVDGVSYGSLRRFRTNEVRLPMRPDSR